MKFDFAIGNPAYQEFKEDGNRTYSAPVYDKFIDAAYEIADCVEMIHPARFLFNAGSTPKAWNDKMLNDEHFKVLMYEENAEAIFPNTDIKGGVVITYHNPKKVFGSIKVFTKYPELNTIIQKAGPASPEDSITKIIFIQNRLDLPVLYSEHPKLKSKIGSDGRDSRLEKNIFEKLPIFYERKRPDCVKTLGIYQGKREYRYLPDKYIDKKHENLLKYKIAVPVANGSGEFGQPLSTPVVLNPNEAYTRSFIGIGNFDTEGEAIALLKYIKSKFMRTMLSILKVTQMTNIDVWKYVPIQDFTSDSDIDWSTSTKNIDRQLYKKYGLSAEEIKFIEEHVKEME